MALAIGEVDRPVFPRSANKPMQATAMLGAGLDLTGELLAVVCASHSGEPYHLDLVRRILAAAELTPDDLQCPPDLPLDMSASRAHLVAGGAPTRLQMNCSGKHAGMLAACVASGWPIENYLDPEHPLQRRIRAGLEELVREPIASVAVDGCGAPQHAVSLSGVARAFGELARGSAAADAMRAYPYAVGGADRDVTQLMRDVPGLLAKDGAEGVMAVALADGTAVALKIDDGAQRARTPVMVAALKAVGVEAAALAAVATTPVYGGGRVVGEVRAVL